MNESSKKNLWLYGLSLAISRFGSQFQFLAVTSLTYAITGSPLLTALQMAVNSLPYIFLARFAGPFADRYDPRKLDAVAYSAQGLLTLLYVLTRNIYAILLLNLLVASIGVFPAVARSRLMPQMVGKDHLFQANARLASINGAAMLLAPTVAGMSLVTLGVTWAFVINSISYFFPAMAMLWIRPVETLAQEKKSTTKEKQSFAPAWTFIRSQPSHLLLLGLFAGYTVGMWAVNALFYPFCRDILDAGADVMGWSISTYFGAYLVTGLALEKWGKALRNPRLLPIGYVLGAIVWSGYTVTRSIPMILLLSAFDGIVYTFTMTRLDTWVQEEAPAQARGRVSALVRAWEELAVVTGQLGGGFIATVSGVLSGIRWSAAITLILLASGVLVGRVVGTKADRLNTQTLNG